MLRPEPHEFGRLAAQGNLVPVVREILADLDTPLSLFRALDDGSTSFLLESVEGGEKWARYSFIGMRRARDLPGARPRGGVGGGRRDAALRGARAIRSRCCARGSRRISPVVAPGLDLPRFTGGAVGHDRLRLGALRRAHPGLESRRARAAGPLVRVSRDRGRLRQRAAHGARGPTRRSAATAPTRWRRYREAEPAIEAVVAKLRGPRPAQPRGEPVRAPMQVRRSMEREAYAEVVKRAKEYVVAGDIFQVVLGFRYTVPLQVDPFTLYRQLRLVNPSPYLFFVRMEGPVLIGSSPEILVRLEGRQIDVRPIAGTRRRGRDAEDEARMEQELTSDPKERAEHLMLVDLGRNDVGPRGGDRLGAGHRVRHGREVLARDAPGLERAGPAARRPRLARPAARHLPDRHALGRAQGARDGDHRRARDACGAAPSAAAAATSTTRATWISRSRSAPCS